MLPIHLRKKKENCNKIENCLLNVRHRINDEDGALSRQPRDFFISKSPRPRGSCSSGWNRRTRLTFRRVALLMRLLYANRSRARSSRIRSTHEFYRKTPSFSSYATEPTKGKIESSERREKGKEKERDCVLLFRTTTERRQNVGGVDRKKNRKCFVLEGEKHDDDPDKRRVGVHFISTPVINSR